MKQRLWSAIAAYLFNHQRLVEILFARALKTPYHHLEGYMLRWWLIAPSKWLPFSARFHFILRADIDHHMHDHPWAFRSIVLSGWYEEQQLTPDGGITYKVRRAGTTHRCELGQFHRINNVSENGVLTLVIIGKKQDSWGFLVNHKRVDWREYLGVSND